MTEMNCRVFVYSREIQPDGEEELRERFAAHGEIISFVLKPSFLLVNYSSSVSATQAILNENTKSYKGQPLTVREAQKKSKYNPIYDAPHIGSLYPPQYGPTGYYPPQGNIIQTHITQYPHLGPPGPPGPWNRPHIYPSYSSVPQPTPDLLNEMSGLVQKLKSAVNYPSGPSLYNRPPPVLPPSVLRPSGGGGGVKQEIEIICFHPDCRSYAEQLDGQIRLMGLKVQILFPDSTLSTNSVLG